MAVPPEPPEPPTPPGTPGVCCYVLGAPAGRTEDDRLVELTAGKPRRLFGTLVLHRDTWVETDTLAEAVWTGEQRPQSARGNLQTYIHQLRQWLPPLADGSARLLSRRGAYRLVLAPGELDADVFADLIAAGTAALDRGDAGEAADLQRQALALWRGEPFSQLGLPGVDAEAARLHELRRVAVDCLGDALTAVGDPAGAVAVLRKQVTEEPLREASWARLLTALHAAGRPGDALAAYEQVRRTLDTELGTTPGAALRAQHERLLAEPSAEAPSAPPGPPGPRGPSVAAVPGPDAEPARRPLWRRPAVAATMAVVFVGVLLVLAVTLIPRGGASTSRPPSVSAAAEVDGYPEGVQARRPVPGFPTSPTAPPAVLFGAGDPATKAEQSKLAQRVGLGMLTTAFDDRSQLPQYTAWRQQIVPSLYREGTALHLIVLTNKEQGTEQFTTRFGPVCGHRYELSDQYLDDMRSLAVAFAGRADGPPLYVSMFHGLEKLTCSTQGYKADPNVENYYRAVRDQYLKIVKIFHRYAPNARVGLNWDGWEATSNDIESGNGLSMFPYFARELAASDFASVSVFEGNANVTDLRDSVAELHKFNLPIMVADYEPFLQNDQAGEDRLFQSDLGTVFTPQSLRDLTGQGLFAWNFRTTELMDRNARSYQEVADIVQRYGRTWDGT